MTYRTTWNYKRYHIWGFKIQTLGKLSILRLCFLSWHKNKLLWSQCINCKDFALNFYHSVHFGCNLIKIFILISTLPHCSFVGPVNPKNPAKSFFLQLWLLKRLGLWAPETENKLIRTLYTLWSYFYRGFFLWIYTLTQIMFFKDVEDMTVSNLCDIYYIR